MKKFIVFLSSVALVGSVSYAMDEEAMDEEMMMEAAAPSVAVGGSASIGIKNDSSADSSLKLIRAYKVTFDSSGTTDGGLVFGAGISLRDDTTEEDAPVVKGSKVYVGGADGSWKVQFGGNDPGIELAGGIGLADDHFVMGDDDASISLEGSFGGTGFRVTMSDPSNSVPTRTREMTTTDQVQMESGLITPNIAMIDWTTSGVLMDIDITVNEQLSGAISDAIMARDTYLDTLMSVPNLSFNENCGIVETAFYYVSPSDSFTIKWDHDGDGAAADADADGDTPAQTAPKDLVFNTGQMIPAEMLDHSGNKEKRALVTTDAVMTYENKAGAEACSATELGAGDPFEPVTTTTGMDNGSAVYAAKNLKDQWSIGFTHSLDTINIGVGVDSGKGLALGVGTELSGVGLNLYYSKSEQENFTGVVVGGKDVMETQENTGLGVKASMAAGEGASVSVAYSTLKEEMMDSSMTDKKIEVDFSYDLGGGATLQASVDKNDLDGGDSNTVLEAKVAMSF